MKRLGKLFVMLLLSIMMISSLGINAYALSWNGSSGGGGGGGTAATTPGFSISYTDSTNVAGYRFSVIDRYGNTQTKVIDIYRSHAYWNMENQEKFSSKYNKKQLIDRQNSSFSTSRTTYNCFRQSDFGVSLPAPSSIESWAKSDSNLNPILRELGYWGGVDDLNFGDKVIVEPLQLVRISKTYCVLTLTEIALYGKHLLGAYSDGGSSSNSGTWGFISSYTNKHFANWLYTPDGMGIWGSASYLSSRATFYTLINSGYGVGVAYNVTQPKNYTVSYNANGGYNTPSSQTKNHGVALRLTYSEPSRSGYDFKGWGTYSSDTSVNYYPGSYYYTDSSTTLYAIWERSYDDVTIKYYKYSFYEERWILFDIEYDETLNVNTYIPTIKTAPTHYEYIDWSYQGNNVFHVNYHQKYYWVSYDANGGSNAPSSQLKYSGVNLTLSSQKPIRTGYDFKGWGTYSSDTSVNYNAGGTYTANKSDTLYAIWEKSIYTNTINHWAWGFEHGEGETDTGTALRLATTTFTAKYNTTYTMDSSKGTRIPNGFYLSTRFGTSSITGNFEWYDFPKLVIQKPNSMYYQYNYYPYTYNISYNLDGGTQNSANPSTYNVLYGVTLQEPTRFGYRFEGWYNGNTKVTGINEGKNANFSSSQDMYNQLSTRQIGNITLTARWYPLTDIYPEFIEPNSVYRRGTEVIASFYVYNDGPFDFKPSNAMTATFVATAYKDNGTNSCILSETQEVIVPSYNKNLVYFKVSIPLDCKQVKFEFDVSSDTEENNNHNNDIVKTIYTAPKPNSQTPDTEFENTPIGFRVPNKNSPVPTLGLPVQNSATWQIWEWNGGFIKKTYGVQYDPTITISADDAMQNEIVNGGITTIKSGYGIKISASTDVSSNGYTMPNINAYTKAQNATVFLPEFGYKQFNGKQRSLEVVGNQLVFVRNENTTNENGVQDNRRVHFTPVYYPNGDYVIKFISYDVWTPFGMISSTDTVNQIKIDGSIYDDWFTTNIR